MDYSRRSRNITTPFVTSRIQPVGRIWIKGANLRTDTATGTNSQIRHYLRTRVGINDIPAEMPRFKLLEQIKEAYYDADETQFDRLSDGALRSLLINEGTLNATQASKLRRHELASFASRVYPTTQARNLLTPAAQQVWLRRHGHFFAHTDEVNYDVLQLLSMLLIGLHTGNRKIV